MGLLSILPGIGDVLDKLIPDADQRSQVKLELAKLADAEAARASSERIAQTEVNKAEASNSSLFVAGWRPAVGWSCVVGFLYNTVIAPAFSLPVADVVFLRDVLLGMLGISVGARSFEKVKGVAQNTLTGNPPADQPQPAERKHKGILKKVGNALWPF